LYDVNKRQEEVTNSTMKALYDFNKFIVGSKIEIRKDSKQYKKTLKAIVIQKTSKLIVTRHLESRLIESFNLSDVINNQIRLAKKKDSIKFNLYNV